MRINLVCNPLGFISKALKVVLKGIFRLYLENLDENYLFSCNG